jgi:virulence factor Mce-like protein
MTRILAILVLAAVAIAGVVVYSSRSDGPSDTLTYNVELDNASGLTEGADLRAAGVKVGQIKRLDLDASTARAIAVVEVSRPEFGGLRKDASCEIKPQSLIGEYFMDCDPGTSPRPLGRNGTVPIERTAGTIAPDLVNNVLRLPQRQKLQVIIAELGAGFAARGGDVNETIKRAIPALRDTDRVLKILAEERNTLTELTRNADTVVGRLDDNKEDVARFIAEARDTAEISGNRRVELAGTIRRLPRFQRILRPTLRDLGIAARRQTPALRDLRAASPALTTLLNRLGPFADASVPAVRSLGRTSVTGSRAVKDARPFVRSLRAVARTAKEPLKNLRFILEHIDDRSKAVEKNPLSPGGAGFTGLEAFMQYFFTQAQAINLFDSRGYVLKLNAIVSECSGFTNGSTALRDAERTKRCSAALGPGGKFEPTPGQPSSSASRSASDSRAQEPSATSDVGSQAAPTPSDSPAPAAAPGQRDLLPGITLPGLGEVQVPGLGTDGRTPPAPETSANLLDFLLG